MHACTCGNKLRWVGCSVVGNCDVVSECVNVQAQANCYEALVCAHFESHLLRSLSLSLSLSCCSIMRVHASLVPTNLRRVEHDRTCYCV